MAEFGLIKRFGIDNGELDGLSPQECFVLGFEVCDVDYLLGSGHKFSKPVHAANEARLRKSCDDLGRRYELTWMPGDSSESWMLLHVEVR